MFDQEAQYLEQLGYEREPVDEFGGFGCQQGVQEINDG